MSIQLIKTVERHHFQHIRVLENGECVGAARYHVSNKTGPVMVDWWAGSPIMVKLKMEKHLDNFALSDLTMKDVMK